jgi:hypothetical protein
MNAKNVREERIPKKDFSRALWFAVILVILALPAAFWLRLTAQKHHVPRSATDMALVGTALEAYKASFGTFPGGDAAEVCRTLSGSNSTSARFLTWPESRRDARGCFLDQWGTPYRFYFNRDSVLIRSAGPNRRFEDSAAKQSDDLYLEQ